MIWGSLIIGGMMATILILAICDRLRNLNNDQSWMD